MLETCEFSDIFFDRRRAPGGHIAAIALEQFTRVYSFPQAIFHRASPTVIVVTGSHLERGSER
jgi:hypothetical protein